MLRVNAARVDAFEDCGTLLRLRDPRGRNGVTSGGHARRFGSSVVDSPCDCVDDFDLDGSLWTGINTGGLETIGEAAVAHVAFADDAASGIELRHAVWAVPDAILAADAGVG